DGIRDFHVTGVQTCALPIEREQRQPDEPGQQAHARPDGAAREPLLGLGRPALELEPRPARPAPPLRCQPYPFENGHRRGVGSGEATTRLARPGAPPVPPRPSAPAAPPTAGFPNRSAGRL